MDILCRIAHILGELTFFCTKFVIKSAPKKQNPHDMSLQYNYYCLCVYIGPFLNVFIPEYMSAAPFGHVFFPHLVYTELPPLPDGPRAPRGPGRPRLPGGPMELCKVIRLLLTYSNLTQYLAVYQIFLRDSLFTSRACFYPYFQGENCIQPIP